MAPSMTLIGAPCSAGAHHAGQERAPAALRSAGLLDRLRAVGWDVQDAGDLPDHRFAHDPEHPRARNQTAVVEASREVAEAVAAQLAEGRLPVVVGGDCSLTVGAVAGCLRHHPRTGLLYLDGDSDLRTPETTTAGNFDGMVIAALLGHGVQDYVGLGGTPPLLPPERLAILGYDEGDIPEAEQPLLDLPFSRASGPQVADDPMGAASAARRHVEAAADAVLVHFDVDVVDSRDLPLANYPHHGLGITLDTAATVLHELCASPAFAGLVLTEVNPSYDPDGRLLDRYLDGLAAALTPRPGSAS